MPDGTHITFAADTTSSGVARLFSDTVDGTGSARLLIDNAEPVKPLSWSPDGRRLLCWKSGATTGADVWVFSTDDGTLTPFLQSPADELSATFSPDGRWVAYASDESGRPEVYVRQFSGPGARSQISVDGGTSPVWSRDGRELFFAKDGTLFAAAVTLGETFTSGPVRRLFSGPYGFDDSITNYGVAPDGRRFLVPRSRDDSTRQLELVLNWSKELDRLALK
jgi:dipeptidyl aminopeptidase/acylaminoacyl peptidase